MNEDPTTRRLDLQGRQQELLLDILKRALQRLTTVEELAAKALLEIDDVKKQMTSTQDVYGQILERLGEVCGDIGDIEQVVNEQILAAAAIGGRDDASE